MAYVYCMPATITEFTHALDNRVSGRLQVEGREIGFSTRKHVVLATNRHYSKCGWKPKLGSVVLIDGDLGRDAILVDHIEADLMVDEHVEDPVLDQISATLGSISTATKTLRHWKPQLAGAPVRFRWSGEIGKCAGLDVDRTGILHAMLDPSTGLWSAWCVDASTGRMAARGMPLGARRLVARTFLGPEEKKRPAPARRPVQAPVPFSDCPF
ncbi:hypothetical protein [Sphingomonas sp. 3-13AW]|uniref:hypothetical protein n=1 Tax=Sphingomonas sp. 3-13AW TaxID=3050450 RepID=UPI003BB6D591